MTTKNQSINDSLINQVRSDHSGMFVSERQQNVSRMSAERGVQALEMNSTNQSSVTLMMSSVSCAETGSDAAKEDDLLMVT